MDRPLYALDVYRLAAFAEADVVVPHVEVLAVAPGASATRRRRAGVRHYCDRAVTGVRARRRGAVIVIAVSGALVPAACATDDAVVAPAAATTIVVVAASVASTVPPRSAGVEVVRLDLVDRSRGTAAAAGAPASPSRRLPTTVYVPPGDGAAPLIVLAHGAGGSPAKFTELASFWARRGYVVAVPRFPLTNDELPAAVVGDFPEQGRDVRYVIAELRASSRAATGALAGRVDPDRLGLFGLSLGSLTVWSAVLDGADLDVDALVQSDGTTLVPPGRLADVDFPVLVAHSDTDPIFPYPDVVAAYDALPGTTYLLTLHRAAHATVGEDADTPADAAYQAATAAFWDRTLGDAPAAPFPPPVAGITSFAEGDLPPPAALPGTR